MVFTQLVRGLRMAVRSLVVLKHNPKLLVFPLIAGVSSLAFLLLLLGSTFGMIVGIEGIGAFQTWSTLETTVGDNPVIVGAALFLGYLALLKPSEGYRFDR